MAKGYVAIPYEYKREMSCLSDAEFGRLCRALIDYSAEGTPIALSGNERFFADRVMMQEDRHKESYSDISDARREAGKKGADARWKNGKGMANDSKDSNGMANDSKNGYNVTVTVPVPVIDTVPHATNVAGGDKNARARFTPPTIEEVRAYCEERHNNVDAERFVAYYGQQGWKLSNGNAMKDWKLAVVNWEKRDERGGSHGAAEKPAAKSWGLKPDVC